MAQSSVTAVNQLAFRSPSTNRHFSVEDIVLELHRYINSQPNRQYSIIVGTDSHRYPDKTIFVTAIVVHRHGAGGRYFWREEKAGKIIALRHQIYQETIFSINLAQVLLDHFRLWPIFGVAVEIHVDIGQRGDTRDMIKEVVGMIKGNGFRAKTKPESFAASSIADRHT